MLTDLKNTPIKAENKPKKNPPKVIRLRFGLTRLSGTCAGASTLNTGVSFCSLIFASVV